MRPPFRTVTALLLAVLLASSFPPEAEGQFGRNRVRYESHDLHLVRAARIDLYHSPDLEPVAEEAARLAERVYRRLSRVLQHEFREQIPILVYGSRHQFQQTNALPTPLDEGTGGVTEFFKRRVVLPFTGSWPEFEHVLVHELVHAFQLDILYGAAPPEVLIQGPRPPLWFLEGMAEYLSLGGADPRTDAWVRDGVLTGYLPDLRTLEESGGWLAYRFGQSFWAFVASRWGEEAVGEILRRTPGLGMDGAFLAVTGRESEELGDQWVRAVRRQVLAGLVEEPGSRGRAAVVRALTPREGPSDPWSLAPALSPDGRRLAYLSTRGGESFDLWLADGEGRPIRRLARGGRSPGLESLRFMSSGPAFSPDGETVAFTARSGGGDVLLLVDDRGRSRRRIDLPLRSIETPSWSPDGHRLVVSGTAGGRSDLWAVRKDGTEVERLTDDRWAALHPTWSPDGRRIAFVTDRGTGAGEGGEGGGWRVAVLELATGVVTLVPGQRGRGNTSPAWSPDGAWLAWVSDASGPPSLHLHRLGGNQVERVMGAPWPLMGITPQSPVLSWSAAGPLVVVRFERGGYALHRIDEPLALPRAPLERGTGVAEGGTKAPAADSSALPSLREESLRRALSERRSLATLRALLDPDTPEPAEGAVERIPVRTRLTPDLMTRPTLGAQFGGAFGSGLYGGAAVSLSDILGNHRVTVGATLSGSLRDAAGGGHWVWSRHRWDVILGVEQSPFYRWVRSSVLTGERRDGREDVFLRELDRRAVLGARYPLNTFQRVELGLAVGTEGRDLLSLGLEADGRSYRRSRAIGREGYVQHSLAWVHDDTRWGPGGPVGGRRVRVELLRSTGGIRFDQLRADLRGYVGRAGSPVLAARLTTLVREGEDADLRTFFWGGPGGIRGWGGGSFGGSGSRECAESRDDVPGGALSPCPARDQLVGSSGALASMELRIPVIREIQVGGLGSLPPVDLLLFSDAGMAWSGQVCSDGSLGMSGEPCAAGVPVSWGGRREAGLDPFRFRAPVGSWGIGVRINLMVVQAEIHHARPFQRPGRGGVWGVVMGPAF